MGQGCPKTRTAVTHAKPSPRPQHHSYQRFHITNSQQRPPTPLREEHPTTYFQITPLGISQRFFTPHIFRFEEWIRARARLGLPISIISKISSRDTYAFTPLDLPFTAMRLISRTRFIANIETIHSPPKHQEPWVFLATPATSARPPVLSAPPTARSVPSNSAASPPTLVLALSVSSLHDFHA